MNPFIALMNDRSLISKSKKCLRTTWSPYVVYRWLSHSNQSALENTILIKGDQLFAIMKYEKLKPTHKQTIHGCCVTCSSNCAPKQSIDWSGLLQFKVYKPKTYLLYGYYITVDIDQQKRIGENYFYYKESQSGCMVNRMVNTSDLARWPSIWVCLSKGKR